jgi:uncharacterized protein (DUF885 family)
MLPSDINSLFVKGKFVTKTVWTICFFCAGLLVIGLAQIGPRFSAKAASTDDNNTQTAWNGLVDEYFDQAYFKFSPTSGTSAGLHQYDAMLEDYSRHGIDQEIEVLHRFEKRVENFDPKSLDQIHTGDRELVLSAIRSRLLTLETIRPWEKNPDTYSSSITNSVFTIMSRRFAPSDERLKKVVAREKAMPAVFVAARENLKNPPRIFTEIALEQLPGIVSFFQNDVPAAFADATDAATKAEFAETNTAVISALQSYEQWLKSDLLPKSNGDFRLGADIYSKKLLYDEMVDMPLDRLLQIGMADLRKNQEEFNRIAKELDPSKTPQEVLHEIWTNHPAPDHLLQSFRDTFSGLIAFIHEKKIITIPSEVRPILEETPPFERAITTASMDTPGPFEKVATEAYFNVTLPGPHDTPEEIEGRMASFNRGVILSTAIHETYPGHYVQFLWMAQAPTKVRKVLGAATNAEGWAHYCEQMMLDEGYAQPGMGAKDVRESKLFRLGQLQDALLRNARFIVGIQMHTGKMSFDQSVDFFVKEGYQSHESGLIETKRGTSDATYLYYTLGKIEILKMREDLKRKQGAAFSLENFHNDFMKQGFPPIKIVRRALLGNDSPALDTPGN